MNHFFKIENSFFKMKLVSSMGISMFVLNAAKIGCTMGEMARRVSQIGCTMGKTIKNVFFLRLF